MDSKEMRDTESIELDLRAHGCGGGIIDEYAEAIRRKCAEKAVVWQMRLCTTDEWPCKTCSECHDLQAAILSDEPTPTMRNLDPEASTLKEDYFFMRSLALDAMKRANELGCNYDIEKIMIPIQHLSAEPAQDYGKPGAVMTMIENGDLTISWECSGCKNTIDDRDDMETVKYCPYCGETIREFLYIEEAKE